MKEQMRNIIAGIVVAAFGSTVGFAASQLSLSSEVKLQGSAIAHLKEADAGFKSDIEGMRMQNLNNMREVIELFKANTATTQEFINLLKVQNQLLMQGSKP